MKPVAHVAPSAFRMTPMQVRDAVASLTSRQPLHDLNRRIVLHVTNQHGVFLLFRQYFLGRLRIERDVAAQLNGRRRI